MEIEASNINIFEPLLGILEDRVRKPFPPPALT